MDNLEIALRKALEKGDALDGAFRRRVYEAAASAMQRALVQKNQATPERLEEQTRRLSIAIETIESEMRARQVEAVPEVAPVAPEPSSVAPEPIAAGVGVSSASADPGHLYAEPRIAPEGTEPSPAAGRDRASAFRFRRGPFATLFAGVVLIALLFAGIWWVIVSGAFVSEEARDTSVPNPPLVLESEDFAGRDPGTAVAPARTASDTALDEGWIILFDPADPAVIELEGGATAAVESDPFGDFARLVTPGEDSLVRIDVPIGTLQELGGGPVQISLRAQSDEGLPTQMSVTCDFAELGDCGRRRFNVGQSASEFLFMLDLPGGAVGTSGALELRTDIDNGGRAIKLLAARIRRSGS